MKFSDIRFANDSFIEMTKERTKAIKEYVSLSKQFLKLREAGILTHVVINKTQLETDIELVTKDMPEEEIDKLPKIEQEYLQFLILPYAIYEGATGKERCLDNFDTETIELFNERIGTRVNLYKQFITAK